MKTLSQYKEDTKTLMKKVADIDAKATNENRDLSAAELLCKNDLMDTVSEYYEIIKTMEREEKIANQLGQPDKPQTVQSSGIVVGDNRAIKNTFLNFGSQLSAIISAGQPGGHVDPRLYNAASGLSETVPSDGGLR